MRFFSATIRLCLASVAIAAPASVEVRQQDTTVVGSVGVAVAALLPALPVYEAAIVAAIAAVQNASASVEAQVIIQAQAVIKQNLGEIVTAVNASTAAIVAATTGAAGGVAGAVAGLTQAEVNQLIIDIQIVENIITGIGATVTGTASLGAAFLVAVTAEIGAVQQAIQPFLSPIVILANAIVTAAAELRVTVTGLQNAVNGLQTISASLFNSVGLQQ